MINLWESTQGLLFMGVIGLLTRTAFKRSALEPSSRPQALSRAPAHIPLPRVAPEEESEVLTTG